MQKRQTVLIIEDDYSVQEALNDFLSDAGFSVILADNGRSGYQCALFTRPDVILLDIEMPVLNGIDTCRMLRERAATMYTPIFFLTGNVDEPLVIEGFRAGCDRFIAKPYNNEEILYLIKRRLTSTDRDCLNQLKLQIQLL
jgi:DNA-binding response OmpR family regulator